MLSASPNNLWQPHKVIRPQLELELELELDKLLGRGCFGSWHGLVGGPPFLLQAFLFQGPCLGLPWVRTTAQQSQIPSFLLTLLKDLARLLFLFFFF